MHYVILITHQSDIKICTTNFQTCLAELDSNSYSNSNPRFDMCLCNETLSDHISTSLLEVKKN